MSYITLGVFLFYGLILHFLGDYIFQDNWMATKKTSSFFPAFIHAIVYSLPFMFLLSFHPLSLVIPITHFFIDRYRLAVYWIKLVNNNWDSSNLGYSEETPVWLSTWLMIIIDNTFHIIINSVTITLYYLILMKHL